MKTILIALAASAALIVGAQADNNSFSTGEGFDRSEHVVDETLFGTNGMGLDTEATASTGMNGNASGVFTREFYERGAEVTQTFTVDAEGNRTVISEDRDYN